MVWEPVLDLFENEITNTRAQSFQSFKNEFDIDAPLRPPQYLSLDFYSQQRNELTELGWYVIRLGRGNFGIFNEATFPKPYLELPIENVEDIKVDTIDSFYHMRKAFKSLDYSLKSAENGLLELARFYGIFDTMVKTIDGSDDYEVGPRGLTTQRARKCSLLDV
jgi:hypothetical protein